MKKLQKVFMAIFLSSIIFSCSAPNYLSQLEDNSVGISGIVTDTQYRSHRTNFINQMNKIAKTAKQSVKKPRRGFRIITITGLVLGVGGTVGSLFVDRDDDKAKIVQTTSALTGFTTGVLTTLNLETRAKRAEATSDYLETEIPLFKSKWPESFGRDLDIQEQQDFKKDTDNIRAVVRKLNK